MLDCIAGNHKFFLVSDDTFYFSALCGRPTGQGTTLCTFHNCKTTKHTKLSRRIVTQGNIYLIGNRNSDFIRPANTSYELEENVVDIWMQDAQSLDNWNHQFRLAINH